MTPYEKTWIDRKAKLKKAGFSSYDKFLTSEIWFQIKSRAKRRSSFQECWLCSSKNDIDLHHLSYRKMFERNPFKDIVACCRHHHTEIHKLAKHKQASIKSASMQVMRKWLNDGNIMAWVRRKIKKDPKCKKWNHLLKNKSIEPIFLENAVTVVEPNYSSSLNGTSTSPLPTGDKDHSQVDKKSYVDSGDTNVIDYVKCQKPEFLSKGKVGSRKKSSTA